MQTKTFIAAPILAIAFGAAAALAATAAFAAPAAPSLQVSYADLNLRDAKDAETMLHRIRMSAASVCAAVPGSSGTSISAIDQFDTCYRTTVKRAVTALAAPAVTLAYNGQGQSSQLAAR